MTADYYVLGFGIFIAITVVAKGILFIGKGQTEDIAVENLEKQLYEYNIELGEELNK